MQNYMFELLISLYIDSSTIQHMCFNWNAFVNYIQWNLGQVVKLGDNETYDIVR